MIAEIQALTTSDKLYMVGWALFVLSLWVLVYVMKSESGGKK